MRVDPVAIAKVAGSDAPAATVDAGVDAAAAAPEDDDVTAREAFGPLALGMAGDDVTKALGAAKIRANKSPEGATGLYTATWTYAGIALNMVAEKASGPWTVRLIEERAPAAHATKAGIHVGSPRAAVEKAYKRSEEGDAKPNEYLVGSVYNGILFHFGKDGAVDEMSMGPFAF